MTSAAWALLALTGALAVLDWVAVELERRPLEWFAKPATMVALLGVALTVDPVDAAARWWLVAALVLCLAGDVLLMLPRRRFVAGLAAFLVGHLLYVVAFVARGVELAPALVGAAIVVPPLLVYGRAVLAGARRSEQPSLAAPVAAYIGVIGVMAVAATGTGVVVAAVGGVLFCLSDGLIAADLFLRPLPHRSLLVMTTYHAAQVCLVLSFTVAA